MKAYSVVRFSRAEKRVFDIVLNSIGVAYPEYHLCDRRDKDQPFLGLAALCRGGGVDVTHTTLTRAREAVEKQFRICLTESEHAHWYTSAPVQPLSQTAGEAVDGGRGVSLLGDPEVIVETLVQARTVQAREALAALRLLDMALSKATPVPTRDEMDNDDWDLG